jgi:hypothetical protein
MKKIANWWNAERVNRPEKGTSQDMCPTNGSAVLLAMVMLAAWAPLLVFLILRGVIR